MMQDDRQVLAATPDGRVRVVRATLGELPALLAVQHKAFKRVAAASDVSLEHMPPATETVEELNALWDHGTCFFVAIAEDGLVVGTVRGQVVRGTVDVGRLAVRGTFLRRGVATALMHGLEAAFPDAEKFDLFTASDATGPIRLYESLGYTTYATEEMGPWTLVRLAKSAR